MQSPEDLRERRIRLEHRGAGRLLTLLPATTLDALPIIAFAAIGRTAHGERTGNDLGEAAIIAAPFLAGWWISAALPGAYRRDALSSYRTAAVRTGVVWLLGGGIGLLVRSAREGRIVPPSFAAISLGFVLALLVPCRVVLVYAYRRL